MQAPTDAGTGTGSLRFVNARTSNSKSLRQAAIRTGSRPAGVAWISIRKITRPLQAERCNLATHGNRTSSGRFIGGHPTHTLPDRETKLHQCVPQDGPDTFRLRLSRVTLPGRHEGLVRERQRPNALEACRLEVILVVAQQLDTFGRGRPADPATRRYGPSRPAFQFPSAAVIQPGELPVANDDLANRTFNELTVVREADKPGDAAPAGGCSQRIRHAVRVDRPGPGHAVRQQPHGIVCERRRCIGQPVVPLPERHAEPPHIFTFIARMERGRDDRALDRTAAEADEVGGPQCVTAQHGNVDLALAGGPDHHRRLERLARDEDGLQVQVTPGCQDVGQRTVSAHRIGIVGLPVGDADAALQGPLLERVGQTPTVGIADVVDGQPVVALRRGEIRHLGTGFPVGEGHAEQSAIPLPSQSGVGRRRCEMDDTEEVVDGRGRERDVRLHVSDHRHHIVVSCKAPGDEPALVDRFTIVLTQHRERTSQHAARSVDFIDGHLQTLAVQQGRAGFPGPRRGDGDGAADLRLRLSARQRRLPADTHGEAQGADASEDQCSTELRIRAGHGSLPSTSAHLPLRQLGERPFAGNEFLVPPRLHHAALFP